jgi:hypothetical protein
VGSATQGFDERLDPSLAKLELWTKGVSKHVALHSAGTPCRAESAARTKAKSLLGGSITLQVRFDPEMAAEVIDCGRASTPDVEGLNYMVILRDEMQIREVH